MNRIELKKLHYTFSMLSMLEFGILCQKTSNTNIQHAVTNQKKKEREQGTDEETKVDEPKR